MDAEAARLAGQGYGRSNTATLAQLTASFLVETGAALDAWANAALGTGPEEHDLFKCDRHL